MEPAPKRKRKNPILRTRQPTLPPMARSRTALGLLRGAAHGQFEVQRCENCATLQYPPREACRKCLSDKLVWRRHDGHGQLIADTVLRHAQELFFRERVPWRMGLVLLDGGATVVTHIHEAVGPAPADVRIESALDRGGQAVLVAMPRNSSTTLSEDTKLRDMTCDPEQRKILVTDGKSAAGQAMVHALAAAGADLIWVGEAEPWKQMPGFSTLRDLPQAKIVPLDVTNERSVRELAGEIGGKVDIVINTLDYHRTNSLARPGAETAAMEMEINYLGLLRLAQAFGPVLKGRAADGKSNAVAWVNLLSIFALANYPQHATYSASKAAALSLSQAMRADLAGAGVRVINVFPGPIDDEWNQLILPPKITPNALAGAIVKALKGAVEDVYPGDIAQDWLARWTDNPKALERELAQGGK